ncbi:MAG: DUF3108 domain-containing protein [Chromatiales bacterium]|nr:DUF3108 domain-containing protein [Chromatiales bacterium]
MTLKSLIVPVIAIVLGLCQPALAEETLTLATYSGKYNLFTLTAERKLTRDDQGLYSYQQESKSFLGSILEKSQFRLGNDNRLIPHHYLYRFNILGKNKVYEIAFDWQKNEALYSKNGNSRVIPIQPGVFDPLSYQLQLQRDLLKGKTELHYPVLKRGKLKEYRFEKIASETIPFKGAESDTIKLKKEPSSQKRNTVIWLSPDDLYQIAQLEHTEKGQTNRLSLESTEITPEFRTWLSQ